MMSIDKFGKRIYDNIFSEMLKFGEKLKLMGYLESVNKPNLFYKKLEGVIFFADMRGTENVPIQEDSSPLFYWKFDEQIPFWKRRRFIEEEFKNLKYNDCPCRVSFEVSSSPEMTYENSTESSFIDWEEGFFEWENGFCKFCKIDFKSNGLFCSDKCKREYEEILKSPCEACGNKIDLGEEVHHHTSYFPEKTILVHKGCHNTIHKTDKYPDLKPSKSEIERFYKKP